MSQADFVNRGQALVSAGQYQEAVKVCRLGLLGRPTTVEGRIVLGQALLALKRYDEVLAEMRVALELDHSAVAAHTLKGEALLRKGDRHGAMETLEKAREIAPGDQRVVQLLTEASRVPGHPTTGAHPAVGYLQGEGGGRTKDYPNRPGSEEDTGNAGEPLDDDSDLTEDEDSYTRPKALSYGKREPNGTPPQSVLEVGDKSGTVEVDPELEAIEVEDDVVKPPAARAAQDFDGPRGNVQRSRKDKPTAHQRPKPVVDKVAPQARQPRGNERPASRESAEELDSADIIAEDDSAPPAQPRGTPSAVRSAVNRPPGPIHTMAMPPAQQPSLAQAIAQAPHVMHMTQLPTQVAAPLPPPPMPPQLSPAQQQTASAVDALFPVDQPPPQQQRLARTVAPGGAPPMPTPTPPPPMMAADPNMMFAQPPTDSGIAVMPPDRPRTSPKDRRTGMRKTRSKVAIVVWILIGATVIGGGVFAGLQIRTMRLDGQIDAARQRATEQAKPDTWKGWADARDSVAGIVQASNTVENRAQLARMRGLLAYEFGDGRADAESYLATLKDATGSDVDSARAYVALASDSAKDAKTAAEAALAAAPDDASAIYISGLAKVSDGDYVAGITALKSALDKDSRPLYAVGLARAYADIGAWDDALAACDKALKLGPEHPSALIVKARVLVQSGRVSPTTASASEVRASLEKIVNEANKPYVDQPRGVSPAQAALATLAMMRLDFARNNPGALQEDEKLLQSIAKGVDDQHFAEEAVDTLFAIGQLDGAYNASVDALKPDNYKGSRRARITQAAILVAMGKPADALDTLAKGGDATSLPQGLVVRAEAKVAKGDVESARNDYEATLKRLPTYERALIGLARLDLAANDAAAARKLIEPRVTANPSPALATVYATVLRTTNDPADREKARTLLDKVVKGPSSNDVTRAQLELARIYRDIGDLHEARTHYAEAAKAGNWDAKLESALLLIEDREPVDGRASLEQLLKEAGGTPPGNLLVEVARARMLVGEQDLALIALDAADKTKDAPRWQVDRERARLAFRRGDIAGAATAIDRALDGAGSDRETFFLAADIAGSDLTKLAALRDKVKDLAGKRLANQAEGKVVDGILALAAGNDDEAKAAYDAADKLAKAPVPPRLLARIFLGNAVVAYDAKNYPAAKLKLEPAIDADPSDYTALLFAIESVRDQDPKAAFDYAAKVTKLCPTNIYGWYFYGSLGAALQNPKALAEAIEKVNALAPTSPQLRELVGLRR